MGKRYIYVILSLTMVSFIMASPQSHAAMAPSSITEELPGIHYHASSYYDDLVDHYEHDQMMWDSIDQRIQ